MLGAFRHFPRWSRWAVLSVAILALLVGSVVVTLSKTSYGYVCLSATDAQYTTRTLDTNTGKIITASLFPLKSYERLLASFSSPDKSKIAFTVISNNYVHLLTMLDLHTLQKQSLTFSLTDNEVVVNGWSADSKYLTVYERKDNAPSTFTIYDAATMQNIVTKRIDNAIWSPQGHDLAYLQTADGNLTGITITSPERSNEQTFSLADKLDPQDQQMSASGLIWSPDGRYLTLFNNSRIWIYDVTAMTLRKVTDHADRGSNIMQWSTDGKTLLYPESAGERANLVAFNPETANSTVLSTNLFGVFRFLTGFKYALVTRTLPEGLVNYSLLNIETGQEKPFKNDGMRLLPIEIYWSPPSQTLSFMYDDGVFWGKLDGSEQREVTGLADMTPLAWNDRWITYSRLQLDGNHPGLIDLQTGEHRTFKEAYPDYFNIYPSPDEQTLALIFAQQPSRHYVKVILISADDQHVTTYQTQSGDMGRLVWSPDGSQFALYTYTITGPTTLHLVRADGTESRHFDNLPNRLYLDKWTTCD